MTPYALSKALGKRMARSKVYRITQAEGRFAALSSDELYALCEVFGVGPEQMFTDERARKA